MGSLSQSLVVLIGDSTALCTEFHCTQNGSYSYLYQIAIKSTSFGLWPRLKYLDLGSKTTLPFRRYSEYILLPLRWFTKPFHRLVSGINPSLQIQAIWDNEWQSVSVWIGLWSHMEKWFVYCTVDSLVINGESNRKVIENSVLITFGVRLLQILITWRFWLSITYYRLLLWNSVYYLLLFYYLLLITPCLVLGHMMLAVSPLRPLQPLQSLKPYA